MTNMKVRFAMLEHGIKQWQVAKLLNISESVFSRRLRKELSEEEQEKIITLIEERSKEYADNVIY